MGLKASWRAWGLAAAWCTSLGCQRAPASGDAPATSSEAVALDAPASARPNTVLPSGAPAAPPPAPGAPSSSAVPSGVDPCHDLCKKSEELHCAHADSCLVRCRESVEDAPCADELRVALRCFIRQPVSRWECGDDDGLASVKDGTCDAEQERYARCVTGAPKAP